MSECTEYNLARKIMGSNFIGVEELSSLKEISLIMPESIPTIMFSKEELEQKKDDYILILGADSLSDGKKLTIRNLKEIFGMDPEKYEPCFYNQDWYNINPSSI